MLKATLESLDGLSEELAGLYTETDGKFFLQVEGMQTDAEVNGLKTSLVKERENNAAWKKFGSPADLAAKISSLEEKAKGKETKGAEEHAAIIDRMKAEFASNMTEAQAKLAGVVRSNSLASAKAELAKSGVIPDALDYATAGLARRIRVNDDGTTTILANDEKSPMIGSNTDGGATFADLAKELRGTQPFIFADQGKGGGGKPPSGGGKHPDKTTTTRAKWEQMTPQDRSTFVKTGGQVTDDA